jgi:23S rRNA (uracil-5-)-methyltransferase RumA
MKKGQVFEGVIEKVAFPNKGHITVDGKTVIVKNGVPGQKVRFSVNKVRSGRAEGRILEVLEKSPLECEPVCPHFADCGGCTYQNLSYEEQLHLKETQVKELLDGAIRDFGYEYVFEGIKESPNHYDYRNKMEFSFGDEVKDGPLALGMHKRGSFYDIVTVDGCRLTDGDFRKILRATLDCFTELGTPFYRKLQHTGYLRHLLVRKAARTGQILVSLVTTSQMDVDLEGWKETLLKLPLEGSFAGILHTINDSLADVVQSDRTEVLYGEEYFYEELLGLRFRISTFSFFQTNSLGAEVLYDTARSYVGDTKDQVIFDLYSGTGTIAQMLAPVAKKVIGVEIVEEAVKAAGENAKLNGLTNCEFIAGDVLKMLDTISDRPDFIVLDPPRDGIHPKALKKIIDYGVDRMIYISCKPTSLARDLEMLQGYGYRVERACCVDMFPWSANVETVVKLSLKKDTPKIEVTMEPDEESNYTPEEKATYSKIKEYVKEKYGVNVHTSYIAQVKRMCGLDMGENYNKSKKENPEVKQCPQEKVEYIKDALRHFKLI